MNSAESKLKTTITNIAIHREGDNPIFGESVINVALEDDAGGCYLIIKSNQEGLENGQIKLNYEDIAKIHEVASRLMKQESVKE